MATLTIQDLHASGYFTVMCPTHNKPITATKVTTGCPDCIKERVARSAAAFQIATGKARTLFKPSPSGPCITEGTIIGETERFWTVVDMRDGDKARPRRIGKRSWFHTEACRFCPGTAYAKDWGG